MFRNGNLASVARRAVFSSFVLLVALGPHPGLSQAIPGDVNGDAHVDVVDVFYLVNFLFAGGPAPIPSEITVLLPGSVPLVMVRIPSGTFQMGSPDTEEGRYPNELLHQVTLTKDYYIGKYEVTLAQWQALSGGLDPAENCDYGWNYGRGENNPVYCVSWYEITHPTAGFLKHLNDYLATTGQPGAGLYRLPTEAEWERAARAGTQTRLSFDETCLLDPSCAPCAAAGQHLWSCGNAPDKNHPVGQKYPNAFGLHDVAGNVAEWVWDWYGAYPSTPVVDPAGPASGSYRVFRGGAWGSKLGDCRSATRGYSVDINSISIGFRLARSQ